MTFQRNWKTLFISQNENASNDLIGMHVRAGLGGSSADDALITSLVCYSALRVPTQAEIHIAIHQAKDETVETALLAAFTFCKMQCVFHSFSLLVSKNAESC